MASTAVCTDCGERFELFDLRYSDKLGGHFCDECNPNPATEEQRRAGLAAARAALTRPEVS